MIYNVSPLTCGRCVRTITDALQAVDPAAKVHVDLAAGTVEVDGVLDSDTVIATLSLHGYDARTAGDIAPAAAGCCGTCHA